jgi:hypothetical protein
MKAHKYEKKKRVPDDRMSRLFPPNTWLVCTGPAKTMILADTLGYHRGGKPTNGVRILVTFTYTSGTPMIRPTLRIEGHPAWMSSAIQRCAVKPLLRT